MSQAYRLQDMGPVQYKGIQSASIHTFLWERRVPGRGFKIHEVTVPEAWEQKLKTALWFKYLDTHPEFTRELMRYDQFVSTHSDDAQAVASYISCKKAERNPWDSLPLELRDYDDRPSNSVLSFPDRGHWGKSTYRGNVSGHIVRNLLSFFRPRHLFVDPAEGGGTSREVAKEMGVPYIGLDLHSGFNLLKDRLIEQLPKEADYVFFHPPYFDIIKYSGNMWGVEPHPDDLSYCKTPEEFIEKMRVALQNIYEAVRRNGHYSVLIGDVRNKQYGYLSFQADIIQIAPGKLDGILIKTQHNCVSSRRQYSGNFIPIAHEYILNFKKEGIVVAMLQSLQQTEKKLMSLSQATWRAVVKWSLQKLGGKATLKELYEAVVEEAPDRIRRNKHWQAKVRQTLQLSPDFQQVDRGIWALASLSP